MPRSSSFVVTLIVGASLACTSAGASRRAPASSTNRNVITLEELGSSSATNAYEAIQRLRPEFLRGRGVVPTGAVDPGTRASRGGLGAVPIAVYLNDNPLGGVEALRTIEISAVEEIRFYNSADATTRWGTGNAAGAIQVITRH